MVPQTESNIVDERNHDETAAILWEQDSHARMRRRKSLELLRVSERSPLSSGRLPGFVQTVIRITLLMLFLLAIGIHYHQRKIQLEGANAAAMRLHEGTDGNDDAKGTVLVTGATGRLGAFLYKELKGRGQSVRAFVRDVDKARNVLGCSSCDESEDVYVGDVTRPEDLLHAMADGSVTTLAVAIGVSPHTTPEVQKAVEFDSVVSSVRALGLSAANGTSNLSVVFCSSMGTEVAPEPKWSGHILHWKLNAETFLATSGIPVTIVKPCGLPSNMPGKNSTLMVGHHGSFPKYGDYHTVSREDVAAVMAEAVGLSRERQFHRNNNLRFDLCSKHGPPTTDLKGLIESARWEWDQPGTDE